MNRPIQASEVAPAVREPGDPRVARSRRVIIDAAVALLVERGFGATTVEAISARSGAAKTTIYRWWPSKGLLAIESFLAAYEREAPFPHGP
ncbi:MAG TPA: helix-turn-helix domain-containing protein, partial [Pseudonocardiaceae bacterium]